MLISACYHEIGFKWAENVIKRLLINNNVPTPDTMVSWTQECYHKPLHPNIILKVIMNNSNILIIIIIIDDMFSKITLSCV